MDPYREKKIGVVKRLQEDWNWRQIRDNPAFARLFTTQWGGNYRKDMKTTQNVSKGKNQIKFKFVHRNYLAHEGHKFQISRGDANLRIIWETFEEPEVPARFLIIQRGKSKFALSPGEVLDVLEDGTSDYELFAKAVYPDMKITQAIDLLSVFHYGLDNVEEALRERFGRY